MSLVDQAIGQQAFEAIHNRLGGIIKEELDTQAVYNYDEELTIPIFKERDIPFNDSELAAMNVLFDGGEEEMNTVVQQRWRYKYAIEVTVNAKGRDETLGDHRAMIRCQKIMGKIRAIIMSPRYVRLGFNSGSLFVNRRYVEKMEFGKPVRQDSSHTVMGRMMVCVVADEDVDFVTPITAVSTTARILLGLTDLGYVWDREFGSVFDDYFASEFE